MFTVRFLLKWLLFFTALTGTTVLLVVGLGATGFFILNGSLKLIFLKVMLFPYIFGLGLGIPGLLVIGAFSLGKYKSGRITSLGIFVLGALLTWLIFTYVGPFPRWLNWFYWPGLWLMAFSFFIVGVIDQFFPELVDSLRMNQGI